MQYQQQSIHCTDHAESLRPMQNFPGLSSSPGALFEQDGDPQRFFKGVLIPFV